MPWGISDDEMDQALTDLFGRDDNGNAQGAAAAPQPTPSELGITAGILSDVPVHLQVPPTDWSNMDLGLSGTDLASLASGSHGAGYLGLVSGPPTGSGFVPGAAGVLAQLQSRPVALLNNGPNPNARAVAQTSEGILGNANDIYHEALNAITSPEFTDGLKRQGGYVNKAGDYVDLGGRGLAVAGIVTGQPELTFPGLGGIAVGSGFHLLGNGAIVLSDILANNRNQMAKDAIGAGVSSVLPPLVDPQPLIDRTGRYFGY